MTLRDAFTALTDAFPGIVRGEWEGTGTADMRLTRVIVEAGPYRKVFTDANTDQVWGFIHAG